MAGQPAASRPATTAIAALPIATFGLVLTWWGWKSGGYFEVTFLPGTMALLFLVAVFLLFAASPAVLRGGALVSLLGLTGLAAWTLISAIWSPVPAIAFSDAQRVIAYVAAFVLGIWGASLLGRRMLLALTPIAAAGAIVGLVTLIALWAGTNSRDFFEIDATLRYPIGYRNAEAAFFLMAVLPTVVLAASAELDWRLRGLLLGSATLMIELAVLAQSRASVFAALIGVAVLIAVHPDRLRVVGWLALALVPAALALPWLLDVFQRDAGNTAAEIPPLHHACVAIAVTSLASGAVGLCLTRFGRGLELPARGRTAIGGLLLGFLGLILIAGAIALVRADGGPGGFVSRHVDELTAGSPNLETSSSRFGLDVRTERGDYWRVALDDFDRHPLDGTGGGGFRSSYLQHRHNPGVSPEDPHGVEMLMLGELGLPGAVLFLTFLVGSVVAVVRARRLGPSAAALAAGALALSAYWLAQASVDWFWSYAAITLPVPFLLGAALAPGLRRDEDGETRDGEGETRRTATRTALAIAAFAVAIAMVPFFLSARYTNQGIRIGQSNAQGAYDDLGRAADLNPWTARPQAAESVIALEVGDDARALSSIDDAIDRSPRDWLLFMQKAKVLIRTDPAGSRQALEQARRLNPRGPEIDELAKQLGVKG
jgi:hypothetical protein